jgi:hypothetical protein
MNLRFLTACALIALAAASAQAKPKVKAGGKAPAAPLSANVFVAREAGVAASFPSLEDKMGLDGGISYFSWVEFARKADGSYTLSSDSDVGGMVAETSPVAGVPGLWAARIALPVSAASGGKAYAVAFQPADLGRAQPAERAILLAIGASKAASGYARVVKAAFSKGAFSYQVAIK